MSSAAFDPAASASSAPEQDGTVRVWSAAGGEALVVLYRYQGPAHSAEFSGDGRRVVSAGDPASCGSRRVRCADRSSAVLRLARTRAERELSPIERQRLLPQDG